MKKLSAALLTLALLLCCSAAPAEEDEGVYVLMTIPYELFYKAETTDGQYDSVSSATRVKPLMMDYAGGSFHYMPDGREITGVIFPVYAPSEALLASYGGEEITDESAVTITVNDGGRKTSSTYRGRDALFQSYPFSYYRLSEIPAVYKTLGEDSTFGAMEGAVIELDGTVRLISDPYAEVCLSVEGAEEVLQELNVNAVVLAADDGTRIGMRHVENIWLKTLSGFNRDDEAYALLGGKRITGVELYTFDAKYVISAGEGLKIE